MRRLALATALVVATAQARDPHLPAPTFDRTPPVLPASLKAGAVLIFSKTNGWRHIEHLPYSGPVVARIVRNAGRQSYRTENAAIFNPVHLKRFSVVVLNSSSGDLFTPEQRAAFEAFIRDGGGVVALHAAGGDPSYAWRLYVERIIGAQFIGHPGGKDQFQRATIRVLAPRHPVMAGIADHWTLRDEWYSFAAPPPADSTILANLDEATYRPAEGQAMGQVHPAIWARRLDRGRIVYAAPGHLPEVYDDPRYRRMIANAVRWVGRQDARP